MLPGAPVNGRQKMAGLIGGALTSCGIAAYALLTGPPPHLPEFLVLGLVVLANAGIVRYAWPATDGFLIRARGERGPGSPSGFGLDGRAGPAPGAGGPPALRAMARLMPSAAGRRWLAEADSVLSEMAAERRGKAARSYLASAPRLVMMMWAGELSRRVRRRSRRAR
jgi:hypothetical protein